MVTVGLHDGIGLAFDDEGKLLSLLVDRFGLSLDVQEELSLSPGPLSAPLPYLPLETGLDMAEARFRGLDPYNGRQAGQTLGAGRRTIFVQQAQSSLSTLGPLEPMVGRARFDYSVTEAMTWRLRVCSACVWAPEESGAFVARLGQGTAARFSSSAATTLEDEGRTLRVDIAAGSAVLELWIESRPPVPMAPTVILCAPDQLREAAVVASAAGVGAQAYVPLVDLSLPPSTQDEFQAANGQLQELAQRLSSIEQEMAQPPQQQTTSSGLIVPGRASAEQRLQDLDRQRQDIMGQIDPLQQRILAYVAWASRRSLLPRLIEALSAGPEEEAPQVLALTTYPADLIAELAQLAPVTVLLPQSARGGVSAWQKQVAEGAARPAIAYWKDLEDLAAQVWNRTHDTPAPAFFTIPDDPAFYPLGLVDALRRGRALLPRGRAGEKTNLADIQDKLNATVTSDEAVLIEADGTTAGLVGALYAYHTGARLCVSPPVSFESVLGRLQTIVDNQQKQTLASLAAGAYRYIGEHRKQFMQKENTDPQLKQLVAGLSILELPSVVPTPYSDNAFVQALSTYLTAQQAGVEQGYRYEDNQWRADLQALTGAVTAAVPEHVRRAADSATHVTAFTSGVPYSLVSGWEGKALGLVLRDAAAFTVLRGLAGAAMTPAAYSLALTVDPGLQTKPAPEAPELSDQTITLRASAASLANLSLLSGLLPLDVLLLHSQGNLDTVILSDSQNRLQEVHAEDLAANLRLPSAPLVVYGAPLAWLTVGASLLSVGASGFVGSLWPVEDSSAESAMRTVLSGVLTKGQSPADALRALPAFDQRTSLAYIYLGLANGHRKEEENKHTDSFLPIYGAAARLAAVGRPQMGSLVYDRLQIMAAERMQDRPLLRAERILLEADYVTRLHSRVKEKPSREAVDKVWKLQERIEGLNLPEEFKKECQVFIWERTAVLEMAVEEYAHAEELARSVLDVRRANQQERQELGALYLLGLIQEQQRHWSDAHETMIRLRDRALALNDSTALASAATGLAFVSLPLAMYPDIAQHLSMALDMSLALGSQLLSETLTQTLTIARLMAQAGAYNELRNLAQALQAVIARAAGLSDADRQNLGEVFAIMGQTAQALQSTPDAAQREEKLALLVEQAQNNDLARSLGLDAWVLSAGAEKRDVSAAPVIPPDDEEGSELAAPPAG